MKGVVLERYAFLEQDAQGVWTSPAGAKIAWMKDSVGNMLSEKIRRESDVACSRSFPERSQAARRILGEGLDQGRRVCVPGKRSRLPRE